ncbi:MAG TPA: NAD(P)-binding domain-containing protein [Candidatus Solibacter sp.]|jgi:putative flavoprotein involved in K+ transport|nr:NAD(P)-binding domain-containing protein [Candidatus Solibacter sp.]
MTERIETVVIGGGQAGLSVGYHLQQRGRPFVILDGNPRVGDSWRNRWDSLRLFTPARANGLDGMRFPAKGDAFIAKDQMADYLEAYARRFNLPVRNGVRVRRLSQQGDGFAIEAGDTTYEASNVVVAMSSYQESWRPAFAANLHPGILQLDAASYKNPSQLQKGPVLVVGVGNSGADIALDVARSHKTILAGTESGVIPGDIEGFFGRQIMFRLVRFFGHHILSLKTPIGRKMRPKMMHRTVPLIRVKPAQLVDAGVERVERMAGVKDGLPLTQDGQTLDVANVIWCTGFRPGFIWIDIPVLGDGQEPMHHAGIVGNVPGLYFVGLQFLYAMTSATVTGVGRDARRVVKHLVATRSDGARQRRSQTWLEMLTAVGAPYAHSLAAEPDGQGLD